MGVKMIMEDSICVEYITKILHLIGDGGKRFFTTFRMMGFFALLRMTGAAQNDMGCLE